MSNLRPKLDSVEDALSEFVAETELLDQRVNKLVAKNKMLLVDHLVDFHMAIKLRQCVDDEEAVRTAQYISLLEKLGLNTLIYHYEGHTCNIL